MEVVTGTWGCGGAVAVVPTLGVVVALGVGVGVGVAVAAGVGAGGTVPLVKVNAGAYSLHPELLPALTRHEYFVPLLGKPATVFVVALPSDWLKIGSPPSVGNTLSQ